MDLTKTMEGLAAIQAMLPAMQEALKERATQQAVDGGAAVAVRPWAFRHPLKGESDPWFGLAYQDWLTLRNEGLPGVFTTSDPASPRAKLFITFDDAAAFLKARAAAQATALADRGGATERLRDAKAARGGRGKEVAA